MRIDAAITDKIARLYEYFRATPGYASACLSIGGSAVLPYLQAFARKVDVSQLRIGEAILKGTIPFFNGELLDLRDNVKLYSSIIEVRRRIIDGDPRVCILLDFRYIHCNPADLKLRWGPCEISLRGTVPLRRTPGRAQFPWGREFP